MHMQQDEIEARLYRLDLTNDEALRPLKDEATTTPAKSEVNVIAVYSHDNTGTTQFLCKAGPDTFEVPILDLRTGYDALSQSITKKFGPNTTVAVI